MNRDYLLVITLGVLAFYAVDTVEAIIGGAQTQIGNFRYLVSLLEVDHGHICGGAIIGERYVLSAAHCFIYSDNTFKSKPVYVLGGTTDLMKMEHPAVNTKVIKIYVPREFNASKIHTTGDIAVLQLQDALKITYTEILKSIKTEINQKMDHVGEKATIAGWGWNKFELQDNKEVGRRTDSLLRYATADVLNNHQCRQEHPALRITDEHLCARVEQLHQNRRGVCFGDDGGALVYDGTVIGILSIFPNNCNERISPAVYTRVSHFLTFIRNAKENYITKNMRTHKLE